MDLNVVVLNGQLSAPIELNRYPSGSQSVRLLVTVRTEVPVRRIDVLPVVWWDPPIDLDLDTPLGTRVWVAAVVRRRFWAAEDGRRSRLELVASEVQFDDAGSVPATIGDLVTRRVASA